MGGGASQVAFSFPAGQIDGIDLVSAMLAHTASLELWFPSSPLLAPPRPSRIPLLHLFHCTSSTAPLHCSSPLQVLGVADSH